LVSCQDYRVGYYPSETQMCEVTFPRRLCNVLRQYGAWMIR